MDVTELEAHRLRLEERRQETEIAHRDAELKLRRDELALKRDEFRASLATLGKKPSLNSPSALAVFGGLLTLLTAVLTSGIQGCREAGQREQEHAAQLALERQKFQSGLIQNAIESAPDKAAAATNLDFLVKAKLTPDYPGLSGILEDLGPRSPSEPTLPSGKTYGTIAAGVIGFDDRVRVADTTKPPFSAICRLTLTAADGMMWTGTGVLVAPRLVLTAGQNVYHPEGGGFIKSAVVVPGGDGDLAPFGKVESTLFKTLDGWKSGQEVGSDLGAILLPREFAGVTPVPVAALQEGALRGAAVQIAGYPGLPPAGPRGTQWQTAGELQGADDRTLRHLLDTGGGMSGAPLLHRREGRPTSVIGIHHGSSEGAKSGVRITDELVGTIGEWIRESEQATVE